MSTDQLPWDGKRKSTAFAELFNAYLTAALWSTNDESTECGGEPLDANYDASDIDDESSVYLEAIARVFFEQQFPFILARIENGAIVSGDWTIWEQAGHDLWLTQNRHGAGFWDRPESLWAVYAEKFTKAAQAFGEINLSVDESTGKIYTS